ncbi:hypothetical protein URH17368_0118 [Alicyclobacillus hesperidum URH17-3-68]|nr:hypothetical protein URH17368_0118 [Alicyclobacillus hesperidum URH17-3-68]
MGVQYQYIASNVHVAVAVNNGRQRKYIQLRIVPKLYWLARTLRVNSLLVETKI